MRHVPFMMAIGCLLGGAAGCAALHGLDEYTTADPRAQETPISAEGAASAAPAAESGADSPDSPTGCQNNHECTLPAMRRGAALLDPAAPAVCIRSTGKCEPLVSEECPRLYGDYANDDSVVLGTLVSDGEASQLEQAAFMAVKEINDNGGVPGGAAGNRPLVLVGCNVAGDVLRASRHLAEVLHVAAVVGPMSGEQVVDVTQQISAKAGTLVITPTSLASAISNLADGDLTWRATPSDAQRAKLVIEQIKDLETVLRATRGLTTVKLGIVHPTDALGSSARDAISGKLILNGRFINDAANAANASVDAFQPGGAAAQSAIATKYALTFKPDIVYITSAEQVANVMVPLENALTVARAVARPYYVLTDAVRTQELLDAAASGALPADIKRRVRGIGVKPDASSAAVSEEFRGAFAARYGAPASQLGAAVSYDATYALAYALAATMGKPSSGANVAHGLRTLAVGAPAAVGAKGIAGVMRELSAGRSVSLRSTLGLMRWDPNGDITGGTLEVWCMGTAGGAPAFGSSGVTMDVETQVVGGAFVQCQ